MDTTVAIGVVVAAVLAAALTFAMRDYYIAMTVRSWCAHAYQRVMAIYYAAASARGVPAGIRPGQAAINVNWLAERLVAAGLMDAANAGQLETATIEALSDNRGLAAEMRRIRLSYKNGATSAPGRPARLILKSSKMGGGGSPVSAFASGQWREAQFYSTMRPEHDPAVPRCVHAWWSRITGEYAIIMEDLTDRHDAIGVNMFFGNQIWGAAEVARPVTPRDTLLRAFISAADLHARYWRKRELLSQTWLKSVPWYLGRDRGAWEAAMTETRVCWKEIIESIATSGSPLSQVKWDRSFIDVVGRSLAAASWGHLQAHLHDPSVPFTLTHGDFHASNMLWQYTQDASKTDPAGTLYLVDWSEVGVWEPAADLGQMMISDVRPEVRRACEKDLVRAYWDRLISNGVSKDDYPFARCWEDYQRAPVERWLWLLVLLLKFPLPVIALQYFHDQVAAYVADHGAGKTFQVLRPVVVFGRR